MATDVAGSAAVRAGWVARAAAQWRDPTSEIRNRARRALAGGMWPAPVVEAALDNVLWDLDEARTRELVDQWTRAGARVLRGSDLQVLVILPGNVIGPAIQSAFCAAVGGARATLKASSSERHLGALVAEQFEAFGPPLAGSIRAEHWSGGDLAAEAQALQDADRVVAFGDDATIEQIRSRLRARDIGFIGYGESYSIGYVAAESDLTQASERAARDICLFDQRGCMSPQTIYVAGDRGRAVLFARALAGAVETESDRLPRAAFEADERALVSDAARRLAASAMEPVPHGLDTLIVGPSREGAPDFVVAVEPFGQPRCIGFGRICVVKPCAGARDVATQLRYFGRTVESIGLAPCETGAERAAFALAGASRLCALGEMQRPPFGYRPSIGDFVA